jgi:hypothetical protein
MICEAGNTEKLIPIIKKFQDSLVKGLVFSALVPINSSTQWWVVHVLSRNYSLISRLVVRYAMGLHSKSCLMVGL